MGEHNKKEAASVLLGCYHRQQRIRGQAGWIETVGIGDSINDAPLLAMVYYPILVKKPDRSYDPDIHLSGMTRDPGIGPVGWNEAVLDLLAQVP